MRRSSVDIYAAGQGAAAIVEDVRVRGDAALIDYAARFDKATLTLDTLRVTPAEFDAAEAILSDDIKDVIRTCSANVRAFHEEQARRIEWRWEVEISKGVFAGEQVTPIDSVGLYVPGGRAAYPSVAYMLCLPAVIAGVERIAIATPPTQDGGVNAATLFTARLCGVETVYKMGGAQAIAALAYGTASVPKVAKIIGPGNPFVTAARRLVADVVDVGMPAGPTDSLILADGAADPLITAWDMLNEAEHGKDSATLLLTHDAEFAAKVADVLPSAIASLPQNYRAICAHVFSPEGYGGIVMTQSLEESLDIANTYAPEHLLIVMKEAQDVAHRIRNAGEILIGPYTPFSFGNFGVGVNNVLPTGGWARSYSATTIWDFVKRTSLSRVTQEGFVTLADSVASLAEYEGFAAHATAVRVRGKA